MDSKYEQFNKNNKKLLFTIKPKPIVFGENNYSPTKKQKLNNGNANTNGNSHSHVNGNKSTLSLQEQRKKLPIYRYREQLLELIKKHDTLIILGETGSGKTTQIPQFLHSAKVHNGKKIGITQPRRVAAVSIAIRVSQEMGFVNGVGETVGYHVRFEDVTSKQTMIKFLTDGMLLQEAIAQKLLMDYSIVILDEAHERTIHSDILFGIVKEAQRLRKIKMLPPLKIVIMSATMDVDNFSKYFNNCPVVYMEGRTYPIDVFYAKLTHEDYQSACVSTFFKIHQEAPANHDVLIFLTGKEEIETVAHQIRTLSKDPDVDGPPVKVCTLYASQSSQQQMQVFQSAPTGTRKVIISTNIAETSVTINGIKYVIDSGMIKARQFHPATGLDLLKVQRISQEQAWQRTGRAGRESEGYCYRIYTKHQFDMMKKVSVPEIQRANLNIVAIQLLALKINMNEFDFMDKPPKDSVVASFQLLKLLGAVSSCEKPELTQLGKKMSQFPLDPRFSKILLAAPNYGCLEEALTIVALLSSESIFYNPPSKKESAQLVRQKFNSEFGDHITLLNIYREFNKLFGTNRKAWCREHYINMLNILYAAKAREQLKEICNRCDLNISTCGSNMDQIRKCLLSGLFTNVAELHNEKAYLTLDKKQNVYVHPSSVIHRQHPKCILYTELVHTTKPYVRLISTIEKDWLEEIVPEYLRLHNIR